jgi:hypothetical protein
MYRATVTQSMPLCTLSVVRDYNYLRDKTLLKMDLFPSSGEGIVAPTLLGRLERTDLNH